MRLKFLILGGALLCLFAGSAFGQGARYDGVAQKTVQGFLAPIAGATVTVCTSVGVGLPCTPVTPIYTDSALTQQIPGSIIIADSLGNWGFWAAPGTYKVSITAAGVTGQLLTVTLPCAAGVSCLSNPTTAAVAINSPGSLTVSGAATLGTVTAGTVDGVCMIDGLSTNRTTLALAIADSTCTVVDDRGFKSNGTIASTITFPNGRPVLVLLGKGVYTGPASGSTFVWPTGSHGSSIVGAGKTSGAFQTGQITITKIISNASNTSDVLSVQGAAGNGIQGIRLEHLMVDGANSAVNCITADTMQNSTWNDIDVENCTGKGYNFTTTNTVANSGTSFNKFDHLSGGGSPTLFFCGGNVANTADFTANTIIDLQGTFGVGASSVAGILLNQCDGNVFEGVTKPFRFSGTGCDLEFDAKAFSNQFYDFYGNTGCNVTVATPLNAADFNFIYGYDVTNGETAPQGAGANTLAFQPNGLIGGAGGPTGLIYPNNSCMSFWDSTTNQVCVVRYDNFNNVHFLSQNTANYYFDSTGGVISPIGTTSLGDATHPWTNLFLGSTGATANNFMFQPAATAAARIVSIADPTVATSLPLFGGIGAGDLQTKRAAGCATAASLNATCDTTITWTTAFANANYTAVCTGDAVTSGVPVIQGIAISAAKTGAAITVRTIAITAAAAQFTNIDCKAEHD